MEKNQEHTGRCLCGSVTLKALGAPEWVSHCHCPSCQKATGAAFATYAGFKASAVYVQGESLTTYVSSPGVVRRFCNKCGSSVSFEGEAWPGEVHLFVTLLEDAASFSPELHSYGRTKQPWIKLADGLPVLHAFEGGDHGA